MPVTSSLANSPSIEKFNPDDITNITPSVPLDQTAPKITKISADNVIPTNSRQFISIEEKTVLGSMLDTITSQANHVMYREKYDRDNDGIVDVSKKALIADTILWENIINIPDSPTTAIDEAVRISHNHDNKDILDKIGIDANNNVVYNNNPLTLPSTLMKKTDYDVDNDGIIDKALYADSTNWANILNKPLFYTPAPHTHKGQDINGPINATQLNGITAENFLKKTDSITLSQISDLDNLKISIKALHGGNASADFSENSVTDETRITLRNDSLHAMTTINPILGNMEKAYETDSYRYKIGNNIIPWNGLPYEYNTPSSIRFNRYARKFISAYYDYNTMVESQVSLSSSNIPNGASTIMYSGVVKGYNNCLIGIPFNATNVFYCDHNGNNINTFGLGLNAINVNGSAWFGGVAFNKFIYCAPYNAPSILKIDSHNKIIDLIENLMIDSSINAKFVNGVLSSNGFIYFAPHNSNTLIELNPKDDSIKYISLMDLLDIDSNYCAAINNPIDDMIYFIPKKNNKIIQFNPYTKDVKVVAITNDYGTNKFSNAVLAPNGLIYAIPSYGYDNIMIFDPNTFDIKYIPFETDAYDEYRDAVIAPNNRIYFIPCGAGSNKIIEYNINTNNIVYLYTITNLQDRWCGGALSLDGEIICLPYTSENLLHIKLNLKSVLNNDIISGYFHK